MPRTTSRQETAGHHSALAALADPTRRRIFERLRSRPQPVGSLVRALKISQPAVSQHLRVLRDARLARAEPRGTQRIYHATPEGLAALRQYLDSLWGAALDAFAAYATREEQRS
jgi:DNA-binding transcriptional ArsR family regulator